MQLEVKQAQKAQFKQKKLPSYWFTAVFIIKNTLNHLFVRLNDRDTASPCRDYCIKGQGGPILT